MAYEYDSYGPMAAMKTWRDENGTPDVTRWLYDEAPGLLTNKGYADGQGPTYNYNVAGRLTRRTWARGVTTDYSYDLLGQITNINYSDSTPDVSFTHDRLGRQLTITDALGTRTNVYNASTLALTEEQLPDGATLYRNQDALGRASGFSIGNRQSQIENHLVAYGYDEFGRFASISSSVLSASSAVTYSYLPGSDLLAGYTLTPGGSASSLTVSRAYEEHRNLILSVSNAWAGTLVSSFEYENDPLGRRIRRLDALASAIQTVERRLNRRP